MQKPKVLTISGCFVAAVLVAWWTPAVKAESNTVTFTVTRVQELVCSEGFGEACPNDFYAKVEIDAQGLVQTGKWCNSCATDFAPNWTFTKDVDLSHNPVTIHVELWDQDDGSPDDQMDIAAGPSALDIQLDLNTCSWHGGGLSGTLDTPASSEGSGDDSARVFFTIASSGPACGDSDQDGLYNGWETRGYDANSDGIIDVDLPAMGANPQRKDLFLELDYLKAADHSHAPSQAAIQDIVRAFTDAPVINPDGTSGIQLHVDVGPLFGAGQVFREADSTGLAGTFGDFGGGGEAIPEAGNTIVDWDGAAGTAGTSFFALKSMRPERDPIFRYVIFAHQTNNRAAVNDCTSGWAKGIPGTNLMVTLGGVNKNGVACWGMDAGGLSVGTEQEQAGTLMHEFGHTLGLGHGGVDSINNKPNYLSVMNYTWQACSVPAAPSGGQLPGGCDYSRVELPAAGVGLDETSLDECLGIDSNRFGFGAVDWNKDGHVAGVTACQAGFTINVKANINGDWTDTDGNGAQNGTEPSIIGPLPGYDDWDHITYDFRTIANFATGGTPTEQEPDANTIERSRAQLSEQTRPALSVDARGPADAKPGDTLSYTVDVGNALAQLSRGPAFDTSLTSTTPDGVPTTSVLGTLRLGEGATRTLSYVVPCSATDATTLTTTSSATAHGLVPDPVSATDAVQTVVHAPVLVLGVSATPAVDAGEAIAYTISYANTGGAAAGGVVVTATLPDDVYYSTALDLGTGPRPDAVTVNGNGTRTLEWNVGTVAASSGTAVISFTARPTLLATSGQMFTAGVSLAFGNANGCAYDALTASATTAITVAPATGDPLGLGYWRNQPAAEPAELLARIQATDQRFDGLTGAADGALSLPEVAAMFAPGGNMPKVLLEHLLALYFDLASRRVNAGTAIDSRLDAALGLATVRDAVVYAQDTLALPVAKSTRARYSDADGALEEIDEGR
ncbi:MAG TPA: hypothetical protein VFX12_08230 [Vicinamibacterales bacterium]|nr:hypothetical protein [Vicinamibacterales bacterium]